jgi:hypothetical protein
VGPTSRRWARVTWLRAARSCSAQPRDQRPFIKWQRMHLRQSAKHIVEIGARTWLQLDWQTHARGLLRRHVKVSHAENTSLLFLIWFWFSTAVLQSSQAAQSIAVLKYKWIVNLRYDKRYRYFRATKKNYDRDLIFIFFIFLFLRVLACVAQFTSLWFLATT